MAGTPFFIATFAASKNADYSKHSGTLTATSTGTSTISGGKLVFASGSAAKVAFSPNNNIPLGQAWSIRFKYTPSYSNAPASPQRIFSTARNSSDGAWSAIITHHNSGPNVVYHTESNAAIKSNNFSWNPVSGTEYEFLYVIDWTNGNYKFYIDGVLKGTPPTGASTRAPQGLIFQIGQDHDNTSSDIATFSIRDLIIYDGAFTESAYTPGYTATIPNTDTWPTEAQTKTGVTFYQSDVLKTGTYDGSDRWTDPGESNVSNGVAYKANSTTNNKTGTLVSVTNTISNTSLGAVGPLSANLTEV